MSNLSFLLMSISNKVFESAEELVAWLKSQNVRDVTAKRGPQELLAAGYDDSYSLIGVSIEELVATGMDKGDARRLSRSLEVKPPSNAVSVSSVWFGSVFEL